MSLHRLHPTIDFEVQTDKPPPLGFEAQTKKNHRYDFDAQIIKL
jgi:hypothetical protein